MVIKGKKIFVILLTAVVVICAVFVLIFNGLSGGKIYNTAAANSSCTLSTVVIDAGHGGEDGGAVAADGTMEKDINLSISKYLKEMFASVGYNVIMTRESDCAIYDEGTDTIRAKKISDMKNRLKIFNQSDSNVVLSIHQNKFTENRYNGTQLFFSPNNRNSALLADSIKNSVVKFLQPENTRETKSANKSIYLLWNSNVPSVIVECGFLSNQSELEKLKTEEYQKEMAFAIFCGFLEYTNTK